MDNSGRDLEYVFHSGNDDERDDDSDDEDELLKIEPR
jgi:hypothetical protein